MSNVYSEGYCTISASDSSDGTGGCFIDREGSAIYEVKCGWDLKEKRKSLKGRLASILPFKAKRESEIRAIPTDYLKIYPYLPPFEKAIRGPLSARAWTLQERELSSRIIHCTKHWMLWECRRSLASEEFPTLTEKSKKKQSKGVLELSSGRTFDENMTSKNPHLVWQSLVEDYSRRYLSKKRDRLPAISALAAKFSQNHQWSGYLAGIWADTLLPALSWFPALEEKRFSETWPPEASYQELPSWASFDGLVRHYGND
jgi:hypothetical protein